MGGFKKRLLNALAGRSAVEVSYLDALQAVQGDSNAAPKHLLDVPNYLLVDQRLHPEAIRSTTTSQVVINLSLKKVKQLPRVD